MNPNPLRRKVLPTLTAIAILSTTWIAAAAGLDPGSGAGADPQNADRQSLSFSADVTNPYFPLVPGRTLVYRGTKDDQPARDEFETTDQVVEIDGVPCRVVLDRLYLNGKLAETTADFFTQDDRGNVHYFGEDTATLDGAGRMEPFGTDGTWHAAEFGAVPGIFMPAHPRVGASYRQEFLEGHAEDHFRILDLHASVTVPLETFDQALRTKEWTPLEPDVLDNKYFVAGIGMVKELAIKGPIEELDLVQIRNR